MLSRRVSLPELMGGIALFTLTFGPLLRLTVHGTPWVRGVPGIRELTLLATDVLPLVAQAAYWLMFVPLIRRSRVRPTEK